jgi:hypothetical protein
MTFARMGDAGPGAAQAGLRGRIMADHNPLGIGKPTQMAVLEEYIRLMGLPIGAMPPPVEYLSLLIDVIAMRHGYTARADAWRHIGINPNRGRSLLGQNAQAIDWPIWKTARDAAIGE